MHGQGDSGYGRLGAASRVACFLLLAIALPAASQEEWGAERDSVAIQVYDSVSAEGVGGAVIRISWATSDAVGGMRSVVAESDEEGLVELEGIPRATAVVIEVNHALYDGSRVEMRPGEVWEVFPVRIGLQPRGNVLIRQRTSVPVY